MHCGTEIPEGAAFCSSCGQPVGNVAQASAQGAGTAAPDRTPTGVGPSQPLLDTRDIVMKKKILSLREHYDLEDTNGRKIGEGDGNFFQMPAKFIVQGFSPESGKMGEVMQIHAKMISLRHQFDLYDNAGNSLGSVKKKIAKLIGQEYWLEQNGAELMRVYGNFVHHDYRMEVNGQQVAQVHEKWIQVRDTFGISITGAVDPRLVIGAVIAIEHLEVSARGRQGGVLGGGFNLG